MFLMLTVLFYSKIKQSIVFRKEQYYIFDEYCWLFLRQVLWELRVHFSTNPAGAHLRSFKCTIEKTIDKNTLFTKQNNNRISKSLNLNNWNFQSLLSKQWNSKNI